MLSTHAPENSRHSSIWGWRLLPLIVLILSGCATQPVGTESIVRIEVKNYGTIRFELLPDQAPNTVRAFKQLVRKGFYDGTTFHRVIPGFMIQGGDPNSRDADPSNDGTGGSERRILAEFNETNHKRGTVSLARGRDPDSARGQFFIVQKTSPHLNDKYTAFGRVLSGMDVVDRIVHVRRDRRDRPRENVVMESVRLEAKQ